jgi:tetratricopeptide (TPR) repeat protein
MVVRGLLIVQPKHSASNPWRASAHRNNDARGVSFATQTANQATRDTNLEDHADPIPGLEQAVTEAPNDASALVALANAYWLTGRGPEAVGDLASRAIAADPENRAGWHLWALSESDPRQRVTRWQQVCARFPKDDLARANVADNAAALAGAEKDYDALDLAIATYEELLATATHKEQREALDTALRNLRGWRF